MFWLNIFSLPEMQQFQWKIINFNLVILEWIREKTIYSVRSGNKKMNFTAARESHWYVTWRTTLVGGRTTLSGICIWSNQWEYLIWIIWYPLWNKSTIEMDLLGNPFSFHPINFLIGNVCTLSDFVLLLSNSSRIISQWCLMLECNHQMQCKHFQLSQNYNPERYFHLDSI